MATKKPPFVRSPYNYDMNEAGDESGLHCTDPSLAQQSFAEESDINFIANRYGLTGELPQVLDLPAYRDFEGIFDFQSAQNAVIAARQQFMTLPAKIRARFENDPQKLMAFLDNPENRSEAEFLGIVKKAQEPLPEPVKSGPGVAPAPEKQGVPNPAPKGPDAAPNPTKTDT